MQRKRMAVPGLLAVVALLAGGCASRMESSDVNALDTLAERYVRLLLEVATHDPGYVDAYYGPPQWREQAAAQPRSLSQLAGDARQALADLPPADGGDALPALRHRYLQRQLQSLAAYVAQLQGVRRTFDDEAQALYDVRPPPLQRAAVERRLKRLDALLPGTGSLSQRYNAYLERYAIPSERLEAVMRAAIAAARQRTAAHIALPPGETFELALVRDKPWSAYNWYQGGYHSRIEINTDLPVSAMRVIELAVHEGYPGHHVYNSLLEQHLVRGRRWIEYSVYPLYSPQSLIAEGSADYGVELAYPPEQRTALLRDVIFPLAGFDPEQAQRYVEVTSAAGDLGLATIEAARDYLDGHADAEQTVQRLQADALASPQRARQRLSFFDSYRSYIVNYALGEQLVASYVDRRAGDDVELRWKVFAELISSPRLPSDLQ